MSDGLERNTRTVMLLTAASRVTGLARDAVCSRLLGTGEAMGAFAFAFMIPNLFRRLFGEGALSAAFLPTYQRLADGDRDRAAALAGGMLGVLTLGLGAIVVIGESVLFLVSAASDHQHIAIWLMMLMLPYMPLVCIVAITGAMLHVHGRFGPTAAAPVLLNGCLIAAAGIGAWWLGIDDPTQRLRVVSVMAGAVVLAGILQVGWSLLALRGEVSMHLDLRAASSPIREVIVRAGPMILGLGVLQINTLLDGAIASWPLVSDTIFGIDYPLDVHSMADISFAQRLYQFPLGVFGIAVATAIYPMLTRRAGDANAFADTVRRGVRLVFFIGLPAGVGLMIVRHPITEVILQGGQFQQSDTDRVAFVLLGYASSVWAYALVQVLTRAFYARDEVMTPVRLAMAMVVLNLALNLTLIWTPLGEAGLAWSTAICAAIQAVIMAAILHRRGVGLTQESVIASLGRTIVLTAVMAIGLVVVSASMPVNTGWSGAAVELAVLTIVGTAIYGGGAVLIRMPEWRWALGQTGD
jgi:putative peptidoglycan lipid II flippase